MRITKHPFVKGTATVVRVLPDPYRPGSFHAIENLGDVSVTARGKPITLDDEHAAALKDGTHLMLNQEHEGSFRTHLIEGTSGTKATNNPRRN